MHGSLIACRPATASARVAGLRGASHSAWGGRAAPGRRERATCVTGRTVRPWAGPRPALPHDDQSTDGMGLAGDGTAFTLSAAADDTAILRSWYLGTSKGGGRWSV
jgi:hypothetical protein